MTNEERETETSILREKNGIEWRRLSKRQELRWETEKKEQTERSDR